MTLVWPPVLVWAIVGLCGPSAMWRLQLPAASFYCKPHHLRKPMTQVEVEKLGVVVDPLGRVPSLPFGHLNAGWLAHLGEEAEGFALWYFEVPRKPASSIRAEETARFEYRGFAWVKGRKVKAEFVFEGY